MLHAASQSVPTGWANLPFVCLLLSIAVLPSATPLLWHRHKLWVTVFWSLALLVPLGMQDGPAAAARMAWHAVLLDYLPLISLLLALYVTGGGILLEGGPFGRPAGNTALLAFGVLAAGLLGTTGAAMVLIRPLLRANAHRRRRAHLAVFSIILIANAGGGLIPLGPPLYVGFLQGVPFFWPLRHLVLPWAMLVGPLLAIFYIVDRRLARDEAPPAPTALCLQGGLNLVLAGCIAIGVLAQSLWAARVTLLGQPVPVAQMLFIALCLVVCAVSLLRTQRHIRQANGFEWAPIGEVAILFAGLFITIAPVIAMLRQGMIGPLGAVVALTRDAAGAPVPLAYFWLSGVLAAFLDNAPTYLVFFQQAGGDAVALTGAMAPVLVAISAGSALFGGLSYIGNAPNLMISAIATHQGVRMPGFLPYSLVAAGLCLPSFLAISLYLLR